jgi:hypothetical protein
VLLNIVAESHSPHEVLELETGEAVVDGSHGPQEVLEPEVEAGEAVVEGSHGPHEVLELEVETGEAVVEESHGAQDVEETEADVLGSQSGQTAVLLPEDTGAVEVVETPKLPVGVPVPVGLLFVGDVYGLPVAIFVVLGETVGEPESVG